MAAIQSSDESGVWLLISIEKPKNALKRLLKASEDGTEYLPFWLYDERKTVVVLPADNFIDTRFVCKKGITKENYLASFPGLLMGPLNIR